MTRHCFGSLEQTNKYIRWVDYKLYVYFRKKHQSNTCMLHTSIWIDKHEKFINF